MALQVWLPLNGDLKNNGLGEITFTGTPAFKANGKIGSCLDLHTGISFSSPAMANAKIYTIAFWAKVNADANLSTNWVDVVGFYDIHPTSNAVGTLRWETCYAETHKTRGISSHDNSTYATGSSMGRMCGGKGEWHHFTFVVDTDVKEYYDGVLAYTDTAVGGWLRGDGWFGQTNLINGELNDFRFYDHALSPKEIKEVSKGLILHYTLDNFDGYGNPNLITNFDTSFLSYEVGATTLFSNQMANGTQEIVQNYADTEKSLHLHSLGGSNRQFRTLAVLAGHTYTISAEYYSPVAQSTAWRGELNGGNYSWLAGNAGAYNTPGKWKKMSYTYTNLTSNATIYFFIYCAKDTDCYVRNIKIEEGSVATEWTPGNYISTIIYDCSGYGHHGNYTGNTTLIDNSARYQYCTYLPNGQTDYITTINPVGNPSDAITMNIWFKSSNTSPGSSYHHMFNGLTTWTYIEMAVHKDGYLRCGLYVGGTRYVANCGSGLIDGNWHMLTMTYNGTHVKRYVDGILLNTQAATGAIDRPNDKFIFGHGTSTGYYCKEAYLSDARIYATALSDEDILQMYKTSAIVDSKQNLYAYDFIEDSTKDITHQGVFHSTSFIEQGPISFQYDKQVYIEPDGSQWLHIFHHNNPANARFASTNTFATGVYLDIDRWYNVEQILATASEFEFMVKQKTTTDATETKWRWIQNINPMVATWDDVKPGTITFVTSGYSTSSQGGLYYRNGNNQRMCIANGNSTNWYGGIGVWAAYSGGIPGYPNTVVKTGYIDLYIRIHQKVQIHNDGQVKANYLYEL